MGNKGCHLIKEKKKIIKRVLGNFIKRAFGKLNIIFQDKFNQFYLNSQRMSDSFYHISELN